MCVILFDSKQFHQPICCLFFYSLFLGSSNAFCFYFGIIFVWNILGLASLFLVIELVSLALSLCLSHNLWNCEPQFVLTLTFSDSFSPRSDIPTLQLWYHNDSLCKRTRIIEYLRALLSWKIGYSTVWWTVRLPVWIELARLTTQTAEILHIDAGKCTATTVLSWIRNFDFGLGNIHNGKL